MHETIHNHDHNHNSPDCSAVVFAVRCVMSVCNQRSSTPTQCYYSLLQWAHDHDRLCNCWPRSASALSRHLRNHADYLKEHHGIEITFSREKNKRCITITNIRREGIHAA